MVKQTKIHNDIKGFQTGSKYKNKDLNQKATFSYNNYSSKLKTLISRRSTIHLKLLVGTFGLQKMNKLTDQILLLSEILVVNVGKLIGLILNQR